MPRSVRAIRSRTSYSQCSPSSLTMIEVNQSNWSVFGEVNVPLVGPDNDVPLIHELVLPIETLLYRGDSALRRAREIRDEIRSGGGAPSAETLDELFALLDLAGAE